MTNAEIFRRAAQYIREHGWNQEVGWGRDGGIRCAEGAIFSVVGCHNLHSAGLGPTGPLANNAIAVATARTRPPSTPNGFDWPDWMLNDWNDAVGRTAEEVIALFDGLAFDEELKEQAQVVDTTIPVAEQILQPTR